jgi:hypothetical protein
MGIENTEALTGGSSESQADKLAGPEIYVDPELNEPNSETELEDIVALLDRETHDGPGDLNDLPPSNFDSYATEGVERGDSA